jgi:hypothetical protein
VSFKIQIIKNEISKIFNPAPWRATFSNRPGNGKILTSEQPGKFFGRAANWIVNCAKYLLLWYFIPKTRKKSIC